MLRLTLSLARLDNFIKVELSNRQTQDHSSNLQSIYVLVEQNIPLFPKSYTL